MQMTKSTQELYTLLIETETFAENPQVQFKFIFSKNINCKFYKILILEKNV